MMRILFLIADPTDTATRLRLQEELRVIQERLRQANLQKTFQLEYRFSVRPRDIRQAILDFKPHIVHFSGHGTSTGELCLEDESGTMQPVKPKALAALFELVADKVQVNCVVLNACYSDIQAKAIVKHIPFVIGMKQVIGDQAAIAFSVGFYTELAANRSIEDAFKSGCVEIQLQDIPEELTPVLHKKKDNLPYEEGFRRWLDSNGHDKSSLLRGQKLRIAMEWSADKILTIEDYQYLNASQELEIRTLYNSRCIISGITAILLIGVGVTGFQLKEKIQSLFLPYVLEPELFSQGERDFFLGEQNYFLKKGIEYFEKSDYSQATSQFKKAKENYNDDIEAEIYYNNAMAHQKGNYLSLAVVVPINATKKLSQEILRGVAQAQSKYNNNLGPNGRLLNIVIVNDNDDPSQAQKVAQELIKDKKVLGVIGHASSAASEKALPKYKNAGLAMISPSSTSTELSMKKFKVFFRTIPSDKITAEKLADYTINQGLKRVVIYYQKDDIYSNSFKQAFEKYFQSKGGYVVQVKNFIEQEQDVNPHHEVIENKEDKADAALFLPKFGLISTVTNIAGEQQNMKENLKLLGGDTLYGSETLRRGKKAIEGLVVAVPWFAKESSSKDFAEQACKIWGGGVSWETAASYDATQAFIKAMSQSDNPTRQTVLEKLKSIKLLRNETSGSELQFKDGERDQKPVLVKVVKGSGDRCGGFQEGGFHFEEVPEKQ